jgi:cell division septum initiation protein DivIVA
LQKLEYLSISSTDLSQGLEYLFDNIKNLYCSIADRPTSKVKAIEQELRKCGVPSRNANNFANPLTAWRKINPDKIKIAQRTREIEQLEKQLKEAHVQLIQQTQQIEKLIDDLTVEREVNQESAEAMDRFYRQNPPSGSISLKNILDEVSVDYLAISRENKRQKKEIQELKDK